LRFISSSSSAGVINHDHIIIVIAHDNIVIGYDHIIVIGCWFILLHLHQPMRRYWNRSWHLDLELVVAAIA
jgi:hypothetical protein